MVADTKRCYRTKLPVLAYPPRFPDLAVTSLPEASFQDEKFESILGAVRKDRRFLPFDEFDPYSWPTGDEPAGFTVLLVDRSAKSNPILHQMGIGVFDVSANPDDSQSKNTNGTDWNLPCSMDDVNTLLYTTRPEGDLTDAQYDFLCALNYPLRPTFSITTKDGVKWGNRRERFIYERLQLKNPPVCSPANLKEIEMDRYGRITFPIGRWIALQSENRDVQKVSFPLPSQSSGRYSVRPTITLDVGAKREYLLMMWKTPLDNKPRGVSSYVLQRNPKEEAGTKPP
jgi:hypothetical protein